MLSRSVKHQQDLRINAILDTLMGLNFASNPEGIEELERSLHKLGMSFADLKSFSSEELNAHLRKFNLGWGQFERFADILLIWSDHQGMEGFKEKSKAIYGYIQQESKMFSFEIFHKMNQI